MVNTLDQANQEIKKATVLEVATLDKMNFPSLVVLTPLPIHRSVKSILFYTSEQSTTFKNLLNSSSAAVISFNEDAHSSVMLKGTLSAVAGAQDQQELQASLNAFQRELHYTKPVVLKFNTMSVKLRHHNRVDYQKLGQISQISN